MHITYFSPSHQFLYLLFRGRHADWRKYLWEETLTLDFQGLDKQGMVDGSASKPALRQDTGYMVEKNYYDIAQYLGAFGAYLMPH